MKILITGSTGFLGSHLCHRLTELGHEVFSLYRSQNKFQDFQITGTPIKGELNSDAPNLWIRELPQDIDVIIHTAGLVHAFNPKQFYEVNHRASVQLINDLKEHCQKEVHFCLISSLAAAGPANKNQPVSEYGRSKLMAEQALEQQAPKTWRQSIIRPPMIIGPHDPAMADVFKMVKQKLVLIPGRHGNLSNYSFVAVYDLVEYIIFLLENDCSHNLSPIYYSAHPKVITYGELINTIQKALNITQVKTLFVPRPILKVASQIGFLLSKFNANTPIRLTPDKYNEIIQSDWTGPSTDISSDHAESFQYQWDLDSIVEKTAKDYIQRNWI